MYTDRNFRTKKDFKDAVKKGERVRLVYNDLVHEGEVPDGTHCIEGPHYPEPHRWYAQARVQGGVVVSVK